MFSKDVFMDDFRTKLSSALESNNPDEVTKVFGEYAQSVHQSVMKDFEEYQRTQDAGILQSRGIYQLTTTEKSFYENLIKVMKEDGDISKGIDGISNAFPQTIIDRTLDDIKSEFPLLAAIDFTSTSTVSKIVVNKKGVQLAVWGALGSKITEELTGSIGVVEVTKHKLSAFMVVSKDMLEAGPVWIDAYIRAVLKEALAAGLCKGIIAGDGKNGPIGMLKDVSESASVVNGVYPDKTAVTITDLSPVTIGGICATIAQGPSGRSRVVPELLVICNPVDYFSKVFPATTYLTPQGNYVHDVLPYPSQIIQDVNVPSGKMIFGLAKRYFMGVGVGGSAGKIDYDDSVRFIDDERAYITKLLGNGMPLDNNAFVVADITGLEPLNMSVVVQQTPAAGDQDSENSSKNEQ